MNNTFDTFWQCYPRKVAKIRAFKAWKKLPETVHQEAIEAIKVQCETVFSGKDKQFIPHPATWLNDGRWEDDVDTSPLPEAKPKRPKCKYCDNPAIVQYMNNWHCGSGPCRVKASKSEYQKIAQ